MEVLNFFAQLILLNIAWEIGQANHDKRISKHIVNIISLIVISIAIWHN